MITQLKKEFDHIDKDKVDSSLHDKNGYFKLSNITHLSFSFIHAQGGTISKSELKDFLASGKVGAISDKDVDAMWSAIDIDNSGEVDFVVSQRFFAC